MKSVTFIKDHVSGFKTGDTKDLRDAHADRLTKEGFVTGGTPAGPDEPEFLNIKITDKKDLVNFQKEYLDLMEGKKVGDTIQVPNPKY